jgi:hypothetical protein
VKLCQTCDLDVTGANPAGDFEGTIFTFFGRELVYHFHPFCLMLFVTGHLETERKLSEIINKEVLAAVLSGKKPN